MKVNKPLMKPKIPSLKPAGQSQAMSSQAPGKRESPGKYRTPEGKLVNWNPGKPNPMMSAPRGAHPNILDVINKAPRGAHPNILDVINKAPKMPGGADTFQKAPEMGAGMNDMMLRLPQGSAMPGAVSQMKPMTGGGLSAKVPNMGMTDTWASAQPGFFPYLQGLLRQSQGG